MLCVAIYMEKGEISESHWNFLLRGPVGTKGTLLVENINISSVSWIIVPVL